MNVQSARHCFVRGFLAGLLGVGSAFIFFPRQGELAAACFTAIGLVTTLQALLENNRRLIWDEKASAWNSNELLARQMLLLFLGIVLATLVAQLVLAPTHGMQEYASVQRYLPVFVNILSHNLTVLGAAFLIALIYREVGFALIMAWNGLHWSAALVQHVTGLKASLGFYGAALGLLVILPHLVSELCSYVLVGLSGSFLNRGIAKYSLASDHFMRVARASVVLAVIAVLLLLAAAFLESKLPPLVFN